MLLTDEIGWVQFSQVPTRSGRVPEQLPWNKDKSGEGCDRRPATVLVPVLVHAYADAYDVAYGARAVAEGASESPSRSE